MRVDEFREAIKNEPFVPVLIRMTSGAEYRLDHPEFIIVPPPGSAQRVAMMHERLTDKSRMIDIAFVESVVPVKGGSQSDAA